MRSRRYHLDYRRAAFKRLEEAEYLFSGNLYTGAVYLAGHAVECMLKALLISRSPATERSTVFEHCRRKIGHSLEALHNGLAERGARIPPALGEDYALVLTWANELRYEPGDEGPEHAESFVKSADKLLRWAERTGSW